MFLVESRSLNTNREQIQTNHCTHRARHDSPFAEGRNFCSAAPDTLGGLQQVTRKKAVTVALTLTHRLCFAAVQHSSTRSEEQNNMKGKEVG